MIFAQECVPDSNAVVKRHVIPLNFDYFEFRKATAKVYRTSGRVFASKILLSFGSRWQTLSSMWTL